MSVTSERVHRGVKLDQPARAGRHETADEGRAQETRALFARFERGDPGARDELIERFLPLARQLARRYQRANEPFDDLLQVASVGLVKAVDRFDPARGVAFSSYAVPTILGELKRYFRDSGWAVHVPRGVQERVLRVDRVVSKLSGRLGRSPAVAEIAEEMDCSVEDVLEAMDAAQAYDAVSLESTRGGDDDDGDSHAERLGAVEERYELVEYGATIDRTMKALPERDRIVLHHRFVDDMTQSEIAEIIGVSQMQVSRIIRRALSRLQAVAEAGSDD